MTDPDVTTPSTEPEAAVEGPGPVPADAALAGDVPPADTPEPDAAEGVAAAGDAPAGTAPAASDAEVVDAVGAEAAGTVDAAVAEAERARDEYLDLLRRERAEFENFRKRSTRERMDALDRGAERVVADMLGVLDNFGFALGAAAEREDDPLSKGVRMVHDQLVGVLRDAGLEDVPGVGSVFDPVHHEAMLQVDSDEPVDEPVVVEILRPGYRYKGRVLRPASVKVAR